MWNTIRNSTNWIWMKIKFRCWHWKSNYLSTRSWWASFRNCLVHLPSLQKLDHLITFFIYIICWDPQFFPINQFTFLDQLYFHRRWLRPELLMKKDNRYFGKDCLSRHIAIAQPYIIQSINHSICTWSAWLYGFSSLVFLFPNLAITMYKSKP